MLVRVLAAGVAGGIVFFGLGFAIFGVLLESYFKANTVVYPGLMKEPMPDMLPLIGWNLSTAFLFAIIFEYWAGIKTFIGGLKGGAIVMFFISLGTVLSNVAFMNIWKGGPVPVIVDVLATTFLGAIAGGVVGLVLGLMNKDKG